jgi:RHS repeat-associated protein
LDEDVAGKITKSYQYSPWGERLSQVKTNTDGSTEDAYYGYNDHTDVEDITDSAGDTKSTYGYTAYGDSDDAESTGIDKPDPADPTKEPYNAYRYEAKRWDANSGTYDMGFRDYDPSLNQFLTRDTYNDALDDLNLATDPFTDNRYAFSGGNPIGTVEDDGHKPADCTGTCLKKWVDALLKSYEKRPYVADNATRHNRARDAAAGVIAMQAVKRTGDEGALLNVRTECPTGPLPTGSKKAKAEPKKPPRADICYQEGDTLYVWEVKGGSATKDGKSDLDAYIAAMKNYGPYKGLHIRPGFDLDIPAVGYVPQTGERVVAKSDPIEDGVITYTASKAEPPRVVVPVPRPVPQGDHEPGWVKAWDKVHDWLHDNLRAPDRQPGPYPVPFAPPVWEY